MPSTDNEPMTRIEFRVPQPLLDDALLMIKGDGWNESEFHRHAWQLGLAQYAEIASKRLGYKKIRQDLEGEAEES